MKSSVPYMINLACRYCNRVLISTSFTEVFGFISDSGVSLGWCPNWLIIKHWRRLATVAIAPYSAVTWMNHSNAGLGRLHYRWDCAYSLSIVQLDFWFQLEVVCDQTSSLLSFLRSNIARKLWCKFTDHGDQEFRTRNRNLASCHRSVMLNMRPKSNKEARQKDIDAWRSSAFCVAQQEQSKQPRSWPEKASQSGCRCFFLPCLTHVST